MEVNGDRESNRPLRPSLAEEVLWRHGSETVKNLSESLGHSTGLRARRASASLSTGVGHRHKLWHTGAPRQPLLRGVNRRSAEVSPLLGHWDFPSVTVENERLLFVSTVSFLLPFIFPFHECPSCGVSGPHWKKKSCLRPHIKYTNENWWAEKRF